MLYLPSSLKRYSTAVIIFSVAFISYGTAQTYKDITDYLNESVKNDKVVGGCVWVYQHGKVTYEQAFGFADRDKKIKFKTDTPAVVASISKPLMGTTLHHLSFTTKKLDLDKETSAYLPLLKKRKLESGTLLTRAPTLSEMLTHTAGFRNDKAEEGRIWYQSWTKKKTLKTVVTTVLEDIPFIAQPGSKFGYSGIGTDVAARVAEHISGIPRNKMLIEHLSKPLDMNDTFFRNKNDLEKRKIIMPVKYHRSKTTGKLTKSRFREAPMDGHYNSSGGNIISTAPDLLKWLKMIKNKGRINNDKSYLPEQGMKSMLSKQKNSYCVKCGLFIRRRDDKGKPVKFGHTGSTGTSVWLDLENDAIFIMLTQTRGKDIVAFRKTLEKKVEAIVEKN